MLTKEKAVFKISDILDHCGSRQNGQVLFELLIKELDRKEVVVLDFAGVKIVSHSFADECLGKLYRVFNKTVIAQKLALINVNNELKEVISFAVTSRLKAEAEKQFTKNIRATPL